MRSLKSKPPAVIRGVAAILGDEQNQSAQEIDINLIDLSTIQPRKYFDSLKMEQLIASIKSKGILEPILVRPKNGGRFELIAGERRFRAVKELEFNTIPVIVKNFNDTEVLEVALIENLQREDLNPVEEVEAILQLLGLKLKAPSDEVISMLNRMVNEHNGKVTSNVTGNAQILATLESLGVVNWLSFATNKLPLLNLPEFVLEALRQGKIEYTKAKVIARIKDREKCQNILERAIDEKMSLSQIRETVQICQDNKQQLNPIQAKLTETFKLVQKSKLNSAKQKKLDKYLDQIRALFDT